MCKDLYNNAIRETTYKTPGTYRGAMLFNQVSSTGML